MAFPPKEQGPQGKGSALVIVAHPASGGTDRPPALSPMRDPGDPDDPSMGGGDDSSQQECGNCRFYKSDDNTCHRYPPHDQGVWAQVPNGEEDWCGEWAAGQPHSFDDSGDSSDQQSTPNAASQAGLSPAAGATTLSTR